MPYGRRSKLRNPRSIRRTRRFHKGTRTRPRRRARRTFRSKWLAPVTLRKNICFTYTDTTFSFGQVLRNSPAEHVFRGNSLYDPDYTGVGVQPYGFDQYFPDLYDQYNCPASKITVYIRPWETLQSVRVFLYPLCHYSSTTDPADLDMIPYCKQKYFSSSGDSSGKLKVSHYMSTRRMFPTSSRDSNEQCNYATNPARQWFWHVGVLFTDSDHETTDYLFFDVKIKYYSIVSSVTHVPDES